MASPDFCLPQPEMARLEWVYRTLSAESSHPLMRQGAITALEGLIKSIKPAPPAASGFKAILAGALDPDKSEATSFPWWFVFDPSVIVGAPLSYERASCLGPAAITGPFFSRESAEAFLAATRYNFGKNAFVYCHSGHNSRGYRDLLALAKAAAPTSKGSPNEAPTLEA